MPILLPPDPGAYFRRFSACAHIDEPIGRMLDIVSRDDDDEGDAEIDIDAEGAGLAYHLSASKWSNGVGHIHFDIARRDDLSDSFEPDSNVETVFSELETFSGQPVSVTARVRFLVPLDDLPEPGLIGALYGLSTSLSGVKFSFTGARMSPDRDNSQFLDDIEWRLVGDSKVSVILYITKESTISDNYLTELQGTALDAFTRFVMEREQAGE